MSATPELVNKSLHTRHNLQELELDSREDVEHATYRCSLCHEHLLQVLELLHYQIATWTNFH